MTSTSFQPLNGNRFATNSFLFSLEDGQRPYRGRTSHNSTKVPRRRKAYRRTGKTEQLHPLIRWRCFMNGWLEADIPAPTHMLTINLPRKILDEALASGKWKSISRYRRDLQEDLNAIVAGETGKWLAAWVIETKSHPHVHYLLWLPKGKIDRVVKRLAGWGRDKLGLTACSGDTLEQTIRRPNNGKPVQLMPISPDRIYKKTGRPGIEGLSDYLGKDLEANFRRIKGRKIGKLVGVSRSVQQAIENPEIKNGLG